MITTTIGFNTSSTLSYNVEEVEVDATNAKLKLLALQDSETFVATAKLTETADRHLGTSALTPIDANVNRVQVGSTWYYNLTSTAVGKYYSIPDATNFNSFTNVYTIRFKIVFPYSGSPSSNNYIIATNSGGNTTSLINLWHRNTGLLELNIYASPAGAPASISLPFVAVSGQEYEMEMVNTGSMLYLFVDGLVFGSTSHTINAGPRAQFKIGTNYTASERSLFYMRDLQIFSTAQHTANFASEIPRLVNVYSNSSAVENSAFLGVDNISALGSVQFANVKFLMKIGFDYKYFSGASLLISDETYTQANTIAEIETNLAVLNAELVNGNTFKLIPVLSSGVNGDDQSSIESTTITYDFYSFDIVEETCFVYGFLYDNTTTVQNGTIRFFSKKPFKVGNRITVMDTTVSSDNLGFFEFNAIIPDSSYPINFELSFTDADGKLWKDKGTVIIPLQPFASFNAVRQ